jgi:hypothetical protein
MNKYLEKIAAARKPINKVELAPGVFYNLDKHELTPTPAHMNEFLAKKDTQNRLFTGSVGSVYGTAIGVGIGDRLGSGRLESRGINSNYIKNSEGSIRLNPTLKKFRIGGGILGALGLGSAMYAIGGLDPTQKKPLKDGYLEKLERKYEKEIDRLEGWDQYD